jgi:hypothetical protein
MDKTVKLWDITTSTCLKTFSHTDYGEFSRWIKFNPFIVVSSFPKERDSPYFPPSFVWTPLFRLDSSLA